MEKLIDRWYNLRLSSLLFLKEKVSPGRMARVLSFILFPLEFLYLTNRHMHYDRVNDEFILFGVKYSGDVFRNLRLPGNIFQVSEVKDQRVCVVSLGSVSKPNRRDRRKRLTKKSK